MSVKPVPVLTVDGPSGAGKGTISRLLTRRLGWWRLDSGALYRVVGLAATREGLIGTGGEGAAAGGISGKTDYHPEAHKSGPAGGPIGGRGSDDKIGQEARNAQESAVAHLCERIEIEFRDSGGIEVVLLDGRNVTQDIRTEHAGDAASRIAAWPAVRAALLARQRAFARAPGLVADGRDMGTVVFPDAALKVFLGASPEERALRRYKQLKHKGIDVSLRDLSRDLARRDERDAVRPVAPLVPAVDAHSIDSTHLSPEEVTERILEWVRDACLVVGHHDVPEQDVGTEH